MLKWIPIIQRKGCPPLFYSYILQGYKDAYHAEILGVPHGINNHQYVDGWVVIEAEESESFNKMFSEKLAQDDYVHFFLSQCEFLSNNLLTLGAEIRQLEFSSASSGDLLAMFARFSSGTIHLMPFLTTIVLLQGVLEDRLGKELANALRIDINSPALAGLKQKLLITGNQVPLSTQSLRDLKGICGIISESYPDIAKQMKADTDIVDEAFIAKHAPAVHAKLVEYLVNYDFLGTDYYVGSPTTIPQLIRQIQSIIQRDASITQESTNGIGSGADYTLPPEAQSVLSSTQRMHYLRQHRIDAMFKSGRDSRRLFLEIASRLGLGYDEFLHCTFTEIYDSLSGGHLVQDLTLIHERMRGYAIYMEGGISRLVVGEDVRRLAAGMQVTAEHSGVLTGTTAFEGVFEGKARVVDTLDEVSTVQPGEVLVAPMTSPYHVPAMTIAGAVVTSEGGILSHAAILCRELRIPCIVGVSLALKEIATGDTVLINATPAQGTVKVIKR